AGGPRPRVAEELLEHEGDVAHQVDRVVPHDHDPRPLVERHVLGPRLLDLDRRFDDLAHRTSVPTPPPGGERGQSASVVRLGETWSSAAASAEPFGGAGVGWGSAGVNPNRLAVVGNGFTGAS